MRAYSIFGIPLHDVTPEELADIFLHIHGLIVTPNPEILLAARRNDAYGALLRSAALALPDGIATVFAVAALHDVSTLRRYPGVDTVSMIATAAKHNKETLLVIGGYKEDYDRLLERLRRVHPELRVMCIDPGVINEERPMLSEEQCDALRHVGSSVAIVALGQGRGRHQGKQEHVAADLCTRLPNVRFAIGVGGAVDVLSGRVVRAPKSFQVWGFEWLWRLCTQPWRFVRIVRAVIVFPTLVAWDTLRQGRFLRACHSVFRAFIVHFFSISV